MIEQVFIAVTELLAIFLIQDKRASHRKFASIFGLLGQPFWFYSTYSAGQWGSFVLCFFFTAAWIKSLKEYWFCEKTQELSPDEYYSLLVDALDKVGTNEKLDYRDYIKRVLKEALRSKHY